MIWCIILGATDLWQPIDSGYGRILKQKIREISDEWLEDEDNMNVWNGNSEQKLDASYRRVLITKWVGEAHRRLQHEDYDGSLDTVFKKQDVSSLLMGVRIKK